MVKRRSSMKKGKEARHSPVEEKPKRKSRVKKEARHSPVEGKRKGNEWSRFATEWYREHKEKYRGSYKACLQDPALKEAYANRHGRTQGA